MPQRSETIDSDSLKTLCFDTLRRLHTFDTYTHVETSHGLTTTRTLTVKHIASRDYMQMLPGIAQVYQYQSQRENTKTAQISPRRRSMASRVSHPKSLSAGIDLYVPSSDSDDEQSHDRKQSPLGPRHRSRARIRHFTGEYTGSKYHRVTACHAFTSTNSHVMFYASQDSTKIS